ncbi:hypothetical protein AHAS_Ahas16G0137400 [Arachis hypogaea]
MGVTVVYCACTETVPSASTDTSCHEFVWRPYEGLIIPDELHGYLESIASLFVECNFMTGECYLWDG